MLFGKKNKDSKFDLDVPEFQGFQPQKMEVRNPEKPRFPSFEHEFGTIKKEVGNPMPKIITPKEMSISPSRRTPFIGEGKPIFVKIDNYKEAMENIDRIKGLTNEAEALLDRIHKIRSDEDRELEGWHRDLDKVKDRLLTVDKRLFEL